MKKRNRNYLNKRKNRYRIYIYVSCCSKKQHRDEDECPTTCVLVQMSGRYAGTRFSKVEGYPEGNVSVTFLGKA